MQRLIDPDVSGILFTADPVTGHRGVASIDAGFGLGEALVSGLVNADLYRVDRRTGEVLLARAGDKAFAIRPTPGGGTTREGLPELKRRARALTDEQVRALAGIGARIESHFGGLPVHQIMHRGRRHLGVAGPAHHPLFRSAVPREPASIFMTSVMQVMLDAMPRLAGRSGASSSSGKGAPSCSAPALSRPWLRRQALHRVDGSCACAGPAALLGLARAYEALSRGARGPDQHFRLPAGRHDAVLGLSWVRGRCWLAYRLRLLRDPQRARRIRPRARDDRASRRGAFAPCINRSGSVSASR